MKRRCFFEHYKVIGEKLMSDTVLAFGITVLLLAALAAWVPLLHMAERLAKRNARTVARQSPQNREPISAAGFEREIAQ